MHQKETKKEQYLSKAEQAEREAAKARNTGNQVSWLKIAANYRDLARDI